MPLTILDIVVIVVVLVSALLAMVRGFVREVLSIASWLAAVAAAYFFYKPLLPIVRPYIESGTVALVVSAAVIFFVALIVASYITTKIADFVIDSRVGAIDRLLGFAFGAARGLLLIVIALLFFNWLVPAPPSWVSAARSKPMLDGLGGALVAILPADLEAALQNHAGQSVAPATTPGNGSAAAPTTPSYSPNNQQTLDTLIQNSGN